MTMTSRERVLDILGGRAADRPAVICPGGMMSMAVVGVMAPGCAWPEAHWDEEAMVALALAMHQASGFDNLALPFCMTVEAEGYGAEIDFGDRIAQPRVARPVLAPDGSAELAQPDYRSGRAATVLRAMARLKARRPEALLMGNLNGPFSILGELAEATQLLRWTRKRPQAVRQYVERITHDLIAFALLQVEAGADALCIAEPTATGEILGGEKFLLECEGILCAFATFTYGKH